MDYDNAAEVLDRLAMLDRRTPDQEDYLETLATRASTTMNSSKLGELLGNSRSLGGKILRGERQLSKAHSRIVAERFKVNPALFL